MKKLILISTIWVLLMFFTLGSAQAYLTTDLVSGTISGISDRTDPLSPIPLGHPFIGVTIDLFEITYDTEIVDQSSTPEAFVFWSDDMFVNFIFPYGGYFGDNKPDDDRLNVVYDPGVMIYQYVEFDAAMTIYQASPTFSAITLYAPDYDINGTKHTIYFSGISVVPGNPVPVPGSLGLLGLGLLAIIGVRRQHKK